MKEYAPAVAAIIAGLFAIISPFITWKLKDASDERARSISLRKERREELKRLFGDIFMMFEQAIGHARRNEQFVLSSEQSQINARVRLLAPEKVIGQYFKVAALLERWSQLHYRATPRQTKIGEYTLTMIEAPDPTAKYKQPAKEALEELGAQLDILIELMRLELEGINTE